MSIKVKECHVARKDVSAQEKENTEEKARERAKGDVPDHVFCVKDHTGLVTVLRIMVERANVLYHLARDARTLHRFDNLIWKVIDVTGSQVQVPLQFGSHSCRILQALIFKESSFSGATMSMGGVDLLQKFQEIYADAGLQLTSHHVPPLRFSFANGQEDVSTSVLPVPCLPWKVIFYIRVLNAPGPVLLGADVHEDLGLVVDHVDC